MDLAYRAIAKVSGFGLALFGIIDLMVLPVVGVSTPVDPSLDQAAIFGGFALLLFGA